MKKSFDHLNTAQQKAIQTIGGRVLILAGAGSGKTSVLTYRMAHLIDNCAVAPEALLGLTFTNKAAREMRERVARLIDPKVAKRITLSTFHSFCMQILRREIHHLGYTNHFSLYDEKDVRRLMLQLARHILGVEGELPSLEQTLANISYAKTRGEEVKGESEWHDQFSKDLYKRLQTCMCAYNAVDFDSLLSLTVRLFEEHPSVLKKYQERYRYIMIDEYQDTNPVQYSLAKLLSHAHQNLCVVGDDDQSIYGWRGAEIKNILHFESTTVIKLEQNYRSTPTILNAANAVISHNAQRHDKKLWSTKDRGDPITLFHAPTELEEAQSVVQRIIAYKKEMKIPWREFAILYRSNILSRPFELALMQAAWQREDHWIKGIPYEIFGGTEFYERAEIKDLLAFLKTIVNPLDQESLLRIINVPRRGISDNTLNLLTQENRTRAIPLWDLLCEVASSDTPKHIQPLVSGERESSRDSPPGKGDSIEEIQSPFPGGEPRGFGAARNQGLNVFGCTLHAQLSERGVAGIRSFVALIKNAQEKFKVPPLHSALSWLVDEIDYQKAIVDDVKSDKMRDFKWENVAHCIDTLAIYEEEMQTDGREGEISLGDFLANTLLDQGNTRSYDKEGREDKVNLMTFHSAKGLEFTACFLVGLEDHIVPHEKSLAETGLEEERRLFYVAMTRAKKRLTLSMARKRRRFGKEVNSNPSRFLFEIPQDLVKITSWQTIH